MDESIVLDDEIKAYCLFKNFKLALHEVNQYLMMLDRLFLDDLDGTRHISLDMLPKDDLSERPLAKQFNEFVVLMYIFDALAPLEVLECNQLPVCLL